MRICPFLSHQNLYCTTTLWSSRAYNWDILSDSLAYFDMWNVYSSLSALHPSLAECAQILALNWRFSTLSSCECNGDKGPLSPCSVNIGTEECWLWKRGLSGEELSTCIWADPISLSSIMILSRTRQPLRRRYCEVKPFWTRPIYRRYYCRAWRMEYCCTLKQLEKLRRFLQFEHVWCMLHHWVRLGG